MDMPRHECGIAGAASLTGEHDVAPAVAKMVAEVEHRGGLAAGLAGRRGAFGSAIHRLLGWCWRGTSDIAVHKRNGRVAEVLTPRRVRSMASPVVIGHTRYATSASEDASLAQPWEHRSRNPDERFVFAWNGTIANAEELRAEEIARGTRLKTDCDSEILEYQLLHAIRQHTVHDLIAVFAQLDRTLDGSFNVMLLTPKGTLAVYRDGQGKNPLERAVTRDCRFLTASENSAMEQVEPGIATEPVNPGELTIVSDGRIQTTQVVPSDPRHCFFQWTYFSHWESVLDGCSVGDSRIEGGRILARLNRIPTAGGIIVYVPDSARLAATGFEEVTGLPMVKDAIVNRLPGQRTFTARDPARTQKAKLKYGINRTRLQGQRIFLMEDSVVRATTLHALVHRLWDEGGVAEIHVRIACPPILAACYYGIDFPEISALVARKSFNGTLMSGTLPQEVLDIMARRLGVNSIQFLPVEAVPLAIGCEMRTLCMACVTGRYPTPWGQKRYDAMEREH